MDVERGPVAVTDRSDPAGGRAGRARTEDRVTAVAGLLFTASVVGAFFTPGTPAGDNPAASIAARVRDDEAGHRASLLLAVAASLLLLVFLVGLSTRLRRWEEGGGLPAGLVLAGGEVFVALLLVSTGTYVALVQTATADFRDPAPLPALASLNDWTSLATFPAAALTALAAAAAILTTRTLPAWLGWLAGPSGVLLLLGVAGLFGADADEGFWGVAGLVGLLLFLIWMLATSIVLLLRAGRSREARD